MGPTTCLKGGTLFALNFWTAWTLGAARFLWLSWPRCDPDIIVETVFTTANGWQYGRQPGAGANGEATFESYTGESGGV